jgi:peptidoglycan/xylan/chitin deacetylase (PgdA/CDA1 family)
VAIGPEDFDARSARRVAERERRAQARRRRRVAAGLLVVVIAAAAIVVGNLGGSSEHAAAPHRAGGSNEARPAADTRPQTAERVPPSRRDRPVPILMYHLVNDPPPGAPFPELYVAPADFAGQMTWLKDEGYTAVTMQQAYDFWTRGVPLPRRPVVVSFDDGYRSVWANALPVLRRLDWPGVLDLELKVLGQPDQGGMSRAMVRELAAGGWEIDSHTVTHPDLTSVQPDQLRTELVRSRELIRRDFGKPANFLCYPAGRYDPAVVAAVKRAGYLGATTTNFGNAGRAQLFTLNRVRINRSDRVPGFERKLTDLRTAGVAPAPPSFGGGGE